MIFAAIRAWVRRVSDLTMRFDSVDVKVSGGLRGVAFISTGPFKEAAFIPLERFPALGQASEEDLLNYNITPGGNGVHWPKLHFYIACSEIFGEDKN